MDLGMNAGVAAFRFDKLAGIDCGGGPDITRD